MSRPRCPFPTTRRELRIRAHALCGRSVAEVAQALGVAVPQSSKQGKGFVGQLAEAALGADPQAGVRPDFTNLGIELKTLPIDARGRPLEGTFVCSIDMARADREQFDTSRLRLRLGWVLWLPVFAPRGLPIADRVFGKARLWQPPQAVWRQLQADWEDLMGAIGAGGASTLTGHRGRLLQVRPKGPTRRARTAGWGEGGAASVAPLGFYLRPTLTRAVLGELHASEREAFASATPHADDLSSPSGGELSQ